jgi:hypothetical protein
MIKCSPFKCCVCAPVRTVTQNRPAKRVLHLHRCRWAVAIGTPCQDVVCSWHARHTHTPPPITGASYCSRMPSTALQLLRRLIEGLRAPASSERAALDLVTLAEEFADASHALEGDFPESARGTLAWWAAWRQRRQPHWLLLVSTCSKPQAHLRLFVQCNIGVCGGTFWA